MIWEYGKGAARTWMFANDYFTNQELRKNEVNMCLGNGYMCVRSCEDEFVEGKSERMMLVAGMYSKYNRDVTCLQNMPDFTNTVFTVNGTEVRPLPVDEGQTANQYSDFLKTFDMRDGMMTRSFIWNTADGHHVTFRFERLVPLNRLHMMTVRCTVTTDADVEMTAKSGIVNIQPDCFSDKKTRIGKDCVGYSCVTEESHIPVMQATSARLHIDGRPVGKSAVEGEDSIFETFSFTLHRGEVAVFQKFCSIHTARDLDNAGLTASQIENKADAEVTGAASFDALHTETAAAWAKVWEDKDVRIDTNWEFEQQALRYAVYNLTITDPRHDGRMNIGARGLQGQGYNNHVFWDTEVYMLPFFLFTDPEAAEKLLEYRYHGLPSARKKAIDRGFSGAMYPWEAAWETDVETCPEWADSGKYEHHITGDVVQAIFYYTAVTGDRSYLEKYGYEIMFSTAKYWVSRVSYNKELDRYEILNTIGPDEMREHIDNNAFTNYIAHLNLEYAMKYHDELAQSDPDRLNELMTRSEAVGMRADWERVFNRLYLPRENADGIVPQDDTYLADSVAVLKERANGSARGMSKQADVMVLFLLFEDLFSKDVKVKNYHFYEPLCVHGSSLSRSSYSILSSDVGEKEEAYKLFLDASQEDLGAGRDCHDGIHTAAAGGLWQCAVLGFMGVRLYGTALRIQPNLPDKWRSAEAKIIFHGQKMNLRVTHEGFTVRRLSGDGEIIFLCGGKEYTVKDELTVSL